MTVPNGLSFARLLAVPVFVALFAAGHENTGMVVYAVGAFTDFLDGYVARRTGAVTELGKALDPLADRVFIVALTLVLIERDALPVWLAATIVVRDVALLGAVVALERRGIPRIRVSFVGKLATAALLFGLAALALAETSFPGAGIGDEVGTVSTVGGAMLYWVAAIGYAREAGRRMKIGTGGGRLG
jgi:cardiolipin synthase